MTAIKPERNPSASPFHEGEQAMQKRLGVRDRIETQGQRVIRDHMPDQHRRFFQMLPFILVGVTDQTGAPWASILTGRPGFITSPDSRRLHIAANPLFGSPLRPVLSTGIALGLLGIQPETRRRNRLNGRLIKSGDADIEIAVEQSFGNCPRYIQTRSAQVLDAVDTPQAERPVQRSDYFDDAAQVLIESADTLFIATAHAEQGADVSHRGGKPGFVHLEDDKTFIFPDFNGNFHFNTLGNILLNPKAGFMFIDFASGDLLYLSGQIEIIWQGRELEAFTGAERLLRFHLQQLIRVGNSLPLRFEFGDYSPVLAQTGSWNEASTA